MPKAFQASRGRGSIVSDYMSYGGAFKIFDTSCFPLLVEEILETVRGGCGVKVTVFDIHIDSDDGW